MVLLNNGLKVLFKISKYSLQQIYFCPCKKQLSTNALTIQSLSLILTEHLRELKIPEAELSTQYIIAHVIGKKTLHGVSETTQLTKSQWDRAKLLCEKRALRIPIQYVLGEWDFRDLTLQMKPPVFIPRPETEELVGHAVRDPTVNSAQYFLEIGPGSGAISLSLLTTFPLLRGIAIEKKMEAYQLTAHNASLLGVQDRLLVLNNEFKKGFQVPKYQEKQYLFDFIISNPPYINDKDMQQLAPEIIRFEDTDALSGGVDGMDIIIQIITSAADIMKKNGSLWLEVDSSHPDMIKEYIEKNPDCRLKYMKTIEDYANRPRFCYIKSI